MVVASVPFLANIAQSACRTVRDQQLGQVHHDRARGRSGSRPASACAAAAASTGRVLVAEHDRPVAAHQVDVLVAVHVPDPGAAAAAHELRVGGGQRPADWCPYIPPGITARRAPAAAGPRSAPSFPGCSSVMSSSSALIAARLRHGAPACGLAARGRGSPGPGRGSRSRRPSQGRWRRASRRRCRARPRRRGAAPSSSPASMPGGEAVTAAGGVHDVDRDRRQRPRACRRSGLATRQPSAPQGHGHAAGARGPGRPRWPRAGRRGR